MRRGACFEDEFAVPVVKLCHRHRRLVPAGERCSECAAGRYARGRAHTDRKHQAFRLAVLARDNSVCAWCGKFGNTLDYVVPLVEGGRAHDAANAVCACKTCNSRRGAALVNSGVGG